MFLCRFRRDISYTLLHLVASRSHAFSREEKAWYTSFAAYSVNQSDFRKRMTSRNTPTRTYLVQRRSEYNHYTLMAALSSQVRLLYTYNSYMYTCIVGRESTLTASWVVVLETALRQCMRQRLLWDSRSRKNKKRSLLPLRRDMMSL